jgi:hypothetical protein
MYHNERNGPRGREAERALGRMILEAQAAGDLAESHQRADLSDGVDTLDTLGIGRDLAAYAVKLAAVPDDVWGQWHHGDAIQQAKSEKKAAPAC